LPTGMDADYGKTCFAWDAELCENAYPGADYDMWCCVSWCWVEETCKTARASTIWPGNFYSSDNCDLDEHAISSCKYNEELCECVGAPAILASTYPDLPTDYGGSCQSWDATGCKARWETNEFAAWNTSTAHDWCCATWCYISGDCPIARQSWLSQLASAEVFFSYATCDDPEPAETFNDGTDTCSARRLRGASEDPEAEEASAFPRQLAGRRRSSRSRSSSSSSPRRRTSAARRRSGPPAPPPSSPRRRAPSPPSAPSPRRRAPSPPRRRDVRRRAPPAPRRRAPTPRRRAPNPPAPTPIESRRRTVSVSGTSQDSTRRRAPASSSSPSQRRRRSGPAVQYGYEGRYSAMSNHNANMPYQASYGYSGYQSSPANSNVNLAMYAAGGFALGFGSSYLLTSSYDSEYGSHRRRRVGPIRWCIVQASGNNFGNLQECNMCYTLYGANQCPSADACERTSGCSYVTPNSFNRDDLSETGFVPKDFTWPLSVTIESVSGEDIVTDPLSGGLCPPTTAAEIAFAETYEKQMSISPELFVVLTKQDILGSTATKGSSSTAVHVASCLQTFAMLVAMLLAGSYF